MNVIHKSLPQELTLSELFEWLKRNSIEDFMDEIKNYFKPEEIAEFEHESSAAGRERNRIEAILKEVTTLIKKGNQDKDGEEAQTISIDIPVTIGMDLLDKQRRQNDDFVEKGYEIEEKRVYGIVNEADETVEYFTEEGVIVADRTRNLTPKEKMKYIGVRSMNANQVATAVNE